MLLQIKPSAKRKQLLKERTVLSKESEKSENKMHGNAFSLLEIT